MKVNIKSTQNILKSYEHNKMIVDEYLKKYQEDTVNNSISERAKNKRPQMDENMVKLQYNIMIIEKTLKHLEKDPYYPIIEKRYFDNQRTQDIADELFISLSTYKRQHKRLLQEIGKIFKHLIDLEI